ncbi:MAG: rhodanese-like domain-containing protein [Deltaproteobacteria bacterium]|nr:MAG: rhodanese-like domain-containing protein [Deltaproteobacteria bacterium]
MREIDVQQLKADRDQGSVPVLFDVRTPAEYAEGHVPGAINVPLDQVPSRLDAFEPHKGDEIYLICRSGGRSGQAGRYLEGQGYKTVNVMGGTAGWANTGLPIDR